MSLREPKPAAPDWEKERAQIKKLKETSATNPKMPDWDRERAESPLKPAADSKEFLGELEKKRQTPAGMGEEMNLKVQDHQEYLQTEEARRKMEIVFDKAKNKKAEENMTDEMKKQTDERELALFNIALGKGRARSAAEMSAVQTEIMETSKDIASPPPFGERMVRDIKDFFWFHLTAEGRARMKKMKPYPWNR